jgi:hypothetical protein
VQGSRASGAERLSALERAARIRERLFRREHREADALEALELYRQIARDPGPARCGAEVSRLLLEAELNADPDATYRALYTLARGAVGECRARIDGVLGLVDGFRPNASALAELDEPAPARAAPSGSAAPLGSSESLASPSGAVATADLTHIERYSAKDAARVVVFVSKPVRFEVGSLAGGGGNKPRLFVDYVGRTTRVSRASRLAACWSACARPRGLRARAWCSIWPRRPSTGCSTCPSRFG